MASIVFSLLNINSYIIVALTACWLLEGTIRNKWNLLRNDLLFFAFLLYFISQAMGIFLAPDLLTGWKHLEGKIGFLILLLIFCSSRFVDKPLFQKLLVAFGIFLTIASVSCLVLSIVRFLRDGNTDVFFYHDLVSPIQQHAIYFSAFIFISILFLTIEARKLSFFKKRPALLMIWILFLIIMMVLLSSKLMLSVLVLYLVYLAFKYQQRRYKRLYIVSVATIVVALALLVALTDNHVKQRFTDVFSGNIELVEHKSFNPGIYFTGFQFRLLLWRISKEILNERHAWWQGVGPANSKMYIQQKFRDLGMYTGDDHGTNEGYLAFNNCHNQFLQATLDSGIFGLIVFLFWCCVFAIRVIKRKHLMLTWMSISIFLFFLSESVLERQYAIILVSFFPLICLYSVPGTIASARSEQ